ncbi:hypothetical protein FRC10_007830 [Ceratobasidium sp. 414]|nr:hypothetical protein FRC10_007830 [Ceratobasidium sp. 414]
MTATDRRLQEQDVSVRLTEKDQLAKSAMEVAADPATFDDFPQPLTLRDYATTKFHERTGFPPKAFQLGFSLAVYAGLDVVCVVSTGGGKSYAFVGNHFFRPDVITWIISPLNVIKHQMVKDYKRCKLKAIAVNAETLSSTSAPLSLQCSSMGHEIVRVVECKRRIRQYNEGSSCSVVAN